VHLWKKDASLPPEAVSQRRPQVLALHHLHSSRHLGRGRQSRPSTEKAMTDLNYKHCVCRDCQEKINLGAGDMCKGCERAGCDELSRSDCLRPDFKRPKIGQSGYTPCACKDCMDIAISSDDAYCDLCEFCKEAGCDETGQSDCQRTDDLEDDDG
jgi:hypothetical protein